MNIIIPMAGEGQRFIDAGYTVHKPAILTIYRKNGEKLPMVVCAALDLPGLNADGSNLTFIDRIFHKNEGVETEIRKHFPKTEFITANYLTEGQASTCLLAKAKINNSEALLIAGCDNGMIISEEKFNAIKKTCDVIVFTYRNNEAVLKNPNAYGWVKVDNKENIIGISVKKAISDTPMNDHAIVATFWFKKGSIFVEAAEKMIGENDRINGEFYIDKVIDHVLDLGYSAKVFELDRYICWGTPKDYEDYMHTIEYWCGFIESGSFLPGVGK